MMRIMNNNKTLFESFQENLKEESIDEKWCQENAEYFFNNDCQDSGDLDEVDYIDVLSDYNDNKAEVKRCADLISNAWKIIKDHIYYYDYKKYIELSDKHTLWQIANDKFPSDEIAAEEYNDQVEQALEEFKESTGVELLLLGRSGRHACVELNYHNAVNYSELVGKQSELEDKVIKYMNDWEPEVEESAKLNESEDELKRLVKDLPDTVQYKGKTYTAFNIMDGDTSDGTSKVYYCNMENTPNNDPQESDDYFFVVATLKKDGNGYKGVDHINYVEDLTECGKALKEQDNTVRIVTSQQEDRNYTITDITELNKISDGDVQPPIDVTGLLNEVDARLNESIGEDWGVINYQSTRFNSETGNSNALFELCSCGKTYLMSMILEENGTLLKVNNTKGQTIFKRKTNDVVGLAESYIRQFVPIKESNTNKTECDEKPLKDRLTNIILSNERLSNLASEIKYLIELSNEISDNGQFFKLLQKKIYSFVAELGTNVTPCMPTDKDEQDYPTFDKMVEALYGKEYVEVHNDEPRQVKGTENLDESVKNTNNKLTEDEVYKKVKGPNGEFFDVYKKDGKFVDTNGVELSDEEIKEYKLNEDDEEKVDEPKQGLGAGYAAFARKPKDIQTLEDKSQYFTDGESSYIICRKEKLSKEEFDRIQDNFLATNEFCKSFEPLDTDNYAFNVIELSCDAYDYKLLVDPAGYDYCRYVAKLGGNE